MWPSLKKKKKKGTRIWSVTKSYLVILSMILEVGISGFIKVIIIGSCEILCESLIRVNSLTVFKATN